MPLSDKPLPDFDRPPVVEVALGVQFADLPGLNAFQAAGFWADHLKDEFPNVVEQPPLTNLEEVFGQPEGRGRTLSVQVGPAPLRFWMSNEDKAGLVQVQRNGFANAGLDGCSPGGCNVCPQRHPDLPPSHGHSPGVCDQV